MLINEDWLYIIEWTIHNSGNNQPHNVIHIIGNLLCGGNKLQIIYRHSLFRTAPNSADFKWWWLSQK